MRKTLFFFLSLAFSLISFASKPIYFSSFDIQNLNVENQYIASNLFKDYVEVVDRYTILLSDNLSSGTLHSEDIQQARGNAKKFNTPYFIVSDIHALGNVLIVNMKMFDTASGNMVWFKNIRQNGLKNLNRAIEILANGLNMEDPDSYGDNLVDKRNNGVVKWGVTTGGGYISASKVDNSRVHGIGILRSVYLNKYIVDIKAESYSNTSKTFNSKIGLNVLKSISPNRTSFVYGAGVYYGTFQYQSSERYIIERQGGMGFFSSGSNVYAPLYRNSGFEIEGNIGFILKQKSTVQLRAMLTPSLTLYKVNGGNPNIMKLGLIASF